jgi:type III restriction enzyme
MMAGSRAQGFGKEGLMSRDIVIENPIINSPFVAPSRHFRFDDNGITDEVVEGRRRSEYFMPIPAAKKKSSSAQGEFVFDEWTRDRIEENKFINEVRQAVSVWKARGRPHATGVSKRLLDYWSDPTRERPLFFCQIEALETAIFLAEAAGREQSGAYFLNELRRFNDDANPGLLRIALKMATGTGKTVVMAMLIAWQTLNKAANPHDGRFSDAFLIVCPGITIRDRLRVVLPSDPNNYYRERDLIPPELREDLGRAKVVITNFHTFLRRETEKASKLAKQILAGENENADIFTETPEQMVRRVLREFGSKRNIVVINDEAHHCYRRRPTTDIEDMGDLQADERREAAQREEEARVWISGIEAAAQKVGIRAIYDLSATPFFLKGSGYPEGTLFPWVVSDFSLIDAIEAGLVKIPRVPIDDDANRPNQLPTYRNLWPEISKALPKRGRKGAGADVEPKLPAALEGALHSLFSNYAKSFENWKKLAVSGSTPPVFIVVANNTTVSKMIYDWISGWPKSAPDGSEILIPGNLTHFSNIENGRRVTRSRTILVDSSQLESGETMTADFKRIASEEIEEFKTEYMARFPGRDAEKLTDEDLLREVMNTVGKPGKLGEHVRCVVSVSMLTEGWDANTVTHILGVRAFGTQLLCEQVVGRGLRRMSYAVDEVTGHFLPEYAEVYGIPFSFIPASGSGPDPKPPSPTTRVRALEDRLRCEISFPVVTGYRWETPDDELVADFGEDSRLALSPEQVPTMTEVAGAVGEIAFHSLDDLLAIRPQAIAFGLARRLLDAKFRDAPDPDDPTSRPSERPWLFPKLFKIVETWMNDPTLLVLKDNAFPQQLAFAENANDAIDRIYLGIVRAEGGRNRLRPVLRAWDPVGTTRFVDFDTARPVWLTSQDKCHVSHVAADTGSWEQRMAQALEEMPEVVRYVKNQSLGFSIPYTIDQRQHEYFPDFLADIDDGNGSEDLLHLIVEVTGEKKKEKVAKVATTRELWIPAINNYKAFGRWAFVEVTDPWDAHATVRGAFTNRHQLPFTKES